nr:MAG TPA: hypothetical protein [Caudoviricetes sp.]
MKSEVSTFLEISFLVDLIGIHITSLQITAVWELW